MAADLSNVSDAELHRELARREQQMRGVSGSDYYFFAEEDEEADEPGQWLFYLVHRRYWHKHHAIYDKQGDQLLILPPGFAKVTESTFEFQGSVEDGKRLLKEYGYVELDRFGPYGQMWHKMLFVTYIRVAGKNLRVDCTCDTAELRALMAPDAHRWNEPGSFREFATLEEYRTWIASLAPDLVVDLRGYGDGCRVSLMTGEVARSLPPYPEWMARVINV